MPKMKTNKGAAKRFQVSKSGKVRFQRAGKRHLLTAKPKKRKRHLRIDGELDPGQVGLLKNMMPYA